MKPFVVTISRQFASLGRTIAKDLSGRLGVEFYDRDIVAMTAKRMGVTVQGVSHHDETPPHHNFLLRHKYLFNFGAYDINEEIFMVESNIIRDLAAKGSCIIVGRCADSILKDHKNVLNVYIYAPFEERLKNCVKELEMDEEDAARKIKEVDEARDNFRKLYCEDVKTDFDHRHLMIDSSRFGVEGCASLLEFAIRDMFKD